MSALEKAFEAEENQRAKNILKQCLDNAKLAASCSDPICQDTGFAVFFVTMGSDVIIEGGNISGAINEGTRQGYKNGYLRSSIVSDPVFDRKNTNDNTPAAIHIDIITGTELSITLLPKGGGSENVSRLAMLLPSDGASGITEFVVSSVTKFAGKACPPVIVGVGIGGTADTAMLLSKKALLRPLGSLHSDERYSRLEREILEKINKSGIGPQGLGGATTALGVHIETYPCHIASLPVAVSMNCHAARKAAITL